MTKFNPLQILIDGFNKLVSTVKRNGALTSLWAVVIFIVLYTFIINPIDVNSIAEQIANNKKIEHNESVDKRLLADEILPDLLDKLRLKYSVDRVSLLEMHNSTSNINDVSFLYFSLVYESLDQYNDSIDYVSEYYQQQRTSDYNSIFKEIGRKGYCYLDNLQDYEDITHLRIIKKVRNNGTNSILFFPIYDNKRVIALLVFSSVKESFDYKDILMHINSSASRIKSLITH